MAASLSLSSHSDEVAVRVTELRLLESDLVRRKYTLEAARRDPVYFVNHFAWTFDPRENPSTVPFNLYPCQEDALRKLYEWETGGKNGIIEKSRDMGATWLTAAYAVHRWLFRQGATIGFGSRKLELVDKLGDPKCIFDKIRTIIANLPPWLMDECAKGYDRRVHDNFAKIINPYNGATITGEGGDEIGRGGRTLIYFVDEAAFLARPLSVDRALSANSRCIVYVSTPNGSNNPFAVKRLSGVYPVVTLHWKQDPRKACWAVVPESWVPKLTEDQELILDPDDIAAEGEGLTSPPVHLPGGFKVVYTWYAKITVLHDPITVAQEYDIDYTASLEGVIIPAKWLRVCVGLKLTPGSRKISGQDVGDGSAEHVFAMRAGPVLEVIERWKDGDPTEACDKMITLMDRHKADHVNYDSVGPGSGFGGNLRKVGAARRLLWTWAGINTGQEPTETVWPDKRKSTEIFRNLKAEMWWLLRVRAEKTYNYVTKGTYYPPDELLALPVGTDTENLISQLSNVTYFSGETGLIQVESKADLKARGVASPDIAEAVVLAFCPLGARPKRQTRSGGTGAPTAIPGISQPIIKPKKRKGKTFG